MHQGFRIIEWTELSQVEPHSEGEAFTRHSALWEGLQVVIKRARYDLSEERAAIAARDLENELHLLSHLQHDNIITLYGAGWLNGCRFLILEHLNGGTLSALLVGFRQQYYADFSYFSEVPPTQSKQGLFSLIRRHKKTPESRNCNSFSKSSQPHSPVHLQPTSEPAFQFHPVPLLELLRVGQELASVLNFMHNKADPDGATFIFRNLNPDNVGFTLNGTVKLFNFCLAKRVRKGSHGARSNTMYQKSKEVEMARYMAPELVYCHGYTESVDAYSWAHIMSELLTLEQPYRDYSLQEFNKRVIHDMERPSMAIRMPAALRSLICRCWDNNVYTRPSFPVILGFLKCISIEAEREGGCAAGEGFYPPPDPELLYSKNIHTILAQALCSNNTAPNSLDSVPFTVEDLDNKIEINSNKKKWKFLRPGWIVCGSTSRDAQSVLI